MRMVKTADGEAAIGFTFIPNANVFWGCAVAFSEADIVGSRSVLWAGPINHLPEDVMSVTDELHVHPDTYELINKNV